MKRLIQINVKSKVKKGEKVEDNGYYGDESVWGAGHRQQGSANPFLVKAHSAWIKPELFELQALYEH